RLRALVEVRAPGVVLEARKRPAGPLALEEHVADHPALTGDGVQRQQADPRQLDARHVAVEAPEELVAAADRQRSRTTLDRLAQRRLFRDEVARHERLLAVLAAADVEQVDVADGHSVADADPAHVELVSAYPRALREDGDV